MRIRTPLMDLVATRVKHRLPLYVSPMYDPAVDTLTLEWNLLYWYAFTPVHSGSICPSEGSALSTVQDTAYSTIWPQRSWFNDLLACLSAQPQSLHLRDDILFQQPGRRLHPNWAILHLHTWTLSSVQSERGTLLRGLPLASPD